MRTSLIALGAALAFATPTYAAAADNGNPNDTGNEIVVTALRGTALKDVDVSTTVIRAAQIEATPATSTDQLINKIPGIFTLQEPAAELHPTGDTFSIRGFGTTTNVNTLVMLDGIPMNDPYFRLVDWNQIAKGQISSIEVIRGGGATSLWGNLAMGGVVNIVSKAPQAGHMDLDVNAGSYDTLSGTVTAGVALTNNVVAGLSLSDTTSDGYNKTPNSIASQNPYLVATSSNNVNVGGSIYATPSAGSDVFVNVMWHRLQEQNLVWAGTQNRWETFRVAIGGDMHVGERGKISLSGWYGSGTMNTTNVAEDPGFSVLAPSASSQPYVSQLENATYHNLGGSLVYQTSLGALHDVKIGVDGRTIEANDPLQFFSATAMTGTTITTSEFANIVTHAQHHFEGAFAQGALTTPGFPLDITLGLRGDFWQTADGNTGGVFKGASFAGAIPNQTYARFDPRIGAKLKLAPTLAVRAAAYSNFAAPGMNQMYRSFFSSGNYTADNPTLKPQTNIGEEVGVDITGAGALQGLTVSATLFNNKLKNFIDYATVGSGCASGNNWCGTNIANISSVRQYVNAGDASLRGFEVLAGWNFGRVALQGGFTYTDAHLTSSLYTTPSAGTIPDPTYQQLGEVPKWIATASAVWKVTNQLTLNATLKSFPSYWDSTSHTQGADGATLVDVGATWKLLKGLEFYTSLQNIGNVHYLDQGYGYTTTNGTIRSGSTVPALGMPFWATFGIRAHI